MKHKAPKIIKESSITRENDRQAATWQERIRNVMAEQGMSQRKLAKLAGLGSTSVRHAVSKADTITIETLRRIANAMNVPLAYLTTGSAVTIDDHGETDPSMPKSIIVLPIHGMHEVPGYDYGRGYAYVDARSVGMLPFALEVGDNSMVGTGSNYQPDPADIVLPGDVVIYDMDADPEPGLLVIVDTGDSVRPKYVVRMLEYDDGEYYAAALTRSFGRHHVSLEDVVGVVTTASRGRKR